MAPGGPAAIDVARYLLSLAAEEPDEPEQVTPLRLQKLLYYVQGWSLAIRQSPMFPDRIEAWIHGPVVRAVFREFNRYADHPIPLSEGAEPPSLDTDDRTFIESIWADYKQFAATRLRRMTHSEPPWRLARGELGPEETSRAEITHASMAEFFAGEYARMQPPGGVPLDRLHAAERQRRAGGGTPLEQVMARGRKI